VITFLKGILVDKQPTRVVLNVHGVGYEAFIPLSTYDQLPATNHECLLLTYDHHREDSHQLFGFMTEDERSMFVMLLGISGVGPKLAVSALSGLTVRELKSAVVQSDIKRLSSISGLGKKTAERIVVELRDKLDAGDALEAAAHAAGGTTNDIVLRDAVMALVALGYAQPAAHKMVMGALPAAGETVTVEEIIRKALGGRGQRPG